MSKCSTNLTCNTFHSIPTTVASQTHTFYDWSFHKIRISRFSKKIPFWRRSKQTLLSIWSRTFFFQSDGASVFTHEFKIVLHNFDISKRVFFYRSSIIWSFYSRVLYLLLRSHIDRTVQAFLWKSIIKKCTQSKKCPTATEMENNPIILFFVFVEHS